jgi:2-isopropylmalate synthase
MGEVSISVDFDGNTLSAKGASTDIVEAAAKAYVSCTNKLLFNREQAAEKAAPAKGRKRTTRKASKKAAGGTGKKK